mgnify:CR=1 FL=1
MRFGLVWCDLAQRAVGADWANQTNGLGRYNLMDDANVPSLLSIPYLGYRSPHDPDGTIATNTRRFVLSEDNRYFYAGTTTHAHDSPWVND